MRRAIHSVCLGIMAALAALPASALIRPDFTPVDLMRASDVIIETEVVRDAKGVVEVRAMKALKGAAPAALALTVQGDAWESAGLPVGKPALALLFLAQDFSAAGDVNAKERPVGAMHAGNVWFSLYAAGNGYEARADVQDLKSVWAGATEMLQRGVKYVLADPTRAAFPVSVGVRWRGETALGAGKGKIHGVKAVEWTVAGPPHVFILSSEGDSLFRREDGGFTNVAGGLGLGSLSKQAAWMDLNADGRLDLVSWDGAAASAWLQSPHGRFAAKGAPLALPVCTGLAAVRPASPARPAMAAGGDGGVTLLTLGESGLVAAESLVLPPAARATLGVAGPLLAADFDANGWTDIAQAYEQGLIVWPGAAHGFGEARLALAARLGKDLSAADAGDLDGDGLLEIVLAGRQGGTESQGANILANRGGLVFAPAWIEGGETYKIETRARTCQVCDINADGRPDLMLTHERVGPVFLFNRGFRTFGTANELTLAGATAGEGDAAKPLQCGNIFGSGAPYGAVADFDGDGAQDGVFATTGDAWVVWRNPEPAGLALLLSAPPAAGPVRVKVTEGEVLRGAVLALPGRPAYLGIAKKGPLVLEWTDADGNPRKRAVVVMKPVNRLGLGQDDP